MEPRKKPNGRWELCRREAGPQTRPQIGPQGDAEQFMIHIQRRRQLG
jgi:hypothetical protein